MTARRPAPGGGATVSATLLLCLGLTAAPASQAAPREAPPARADATPAATSAPAGTAPRPSPTSLRASAEDAAGPSLLTEALLAGGGVALAAALTSAVYYDQAARDQRDAQRRLDRVQRDGPDPAAAARLRAQTRAAHGRALDASTAAWTLGVAGAAALGAGIYLLMTAPDEAPPARAAAHASAAPTPSLLPTLGPRGVGLLGHF